MVIMVKCPDCKHENEPSDKEWKYGVFQAKAVTCSKCSKKFNAYYKNGKFSHTIPKSKK